MLRERGDDAGVDIRRRTELEWDAPVSNEARQAAEAHVAVGSDLDVVDDTHPMAEPLGVAPLQCLPDRRQPEGFPGMERRMEVLTLDEMERIDVLRRRISRFCTCHVEPDDANVAVTNGELSDFERTRRGAHGG